MNDFFDVFKPVCQSEANCENIIIEGATRVTVITPALIRIEHNDDNAADFCDMPTQAVINRKTEKQVFSYKKIDNIMRIRTAAAEFCVNSENGKIESVVPRGMRPVKDFDKNNLLGTCRTLDASRGAVKLNKGIISKDGAAVLDDSTTLLLTANGTVCQREHKGSDIYVFAHGHDYNKAVSDYFLITGMPPLIPRFALGNWWSRYKAYTQQEYIDLINRFEEEKIPLTVATIDMDWHWVDIVKRFGKDSRDEKGKKTLQEIGYNIISPGWTGYTWNTELFPDHKGFLAFLKEKNLKITVNLHPASGCRFFEDAYSDFAEFMGIDKNSKKQIHFDITDPKFIEGYFRFLHHPHEQNGVDFWWIDWQQGKKTKIEGLDPLWALNYYHFNDRKRSNARPLILSRFAGAGSHRYPLGFSGDTAQTWACLNFQPYFTSTASNIGYTWWSHDIGGHTMGKRDDELYLRWVQYGVFSPIMRLHSTSNEFMGKEPWKYRSSVNNLVTQALRFRHRLIPYLYSMNRLTNNCGLPLVRPLYYICPEKEAAYNKPNEYCFGTELLVCAVTQKTDSRTFLAGVKAYIPDGRYTDIFTGAIYKGGTDTVLYRDEGSIPVLAKEGAIIPLGTVTCDNSTENPAELELLVYRGTSSFTLYEDDGETNNFEQGKWAQTEFTVAQNGKDLSFSVKKAYGDTSVIPEKRTYIVSFKDIVSAQKTEVLIDNAEAKAEINSENGYLQVKLCGVSNSSSVNIILTDTSHTVNRPKSELKSNIISRAQGKNMLKQVRFEAYITKKGKAILPEYLNGPIKELDSLYYE